MKKLYIYICLIAIALIGIRLLYVLYEGRPQDAYKLKSEVKTDKDSYTLGEEISWKMSICKLHSEEFYSQRSLINLETGVVYPIPEILTKPTLKKGECKEVNPMSKIPLDFNSPPGIYHLCSEIIVLNSQKSIRPFKYCTNKFSISLNKD